MKKSRPLSSRQFKSIYSKVPRLTVEVIIHSSRGVILTKRKLPSWHNMWHIPGGTVLFGESLHQACKRIAREELEVDVQVKKLLGYIEYPHEAAERGFGYAVGITFLCSPKSKLPSINSDGEEIKYFTTIPQNTVHDQKAFLKKLVSSRSS